MASHRSLGRLSEADLSEIYRAPLGVLVLTRTSSGHCDVYQADIERLMARGGLEGIPIGKLIVDDLSPSNRWAKAIAKLDSKRLPVTIIYQDGLEVDQFCTTRAAQLLKRIAAVSARSLTASSGPDQQQGDTNECN